MNTDTETAPEEPPNRCVLCDPAVLAATEEDVLCDVHLDLLFDHRDRADLADLD